MPTIKPKPQIDEQFCHFIHSLVATVLQLISMSITHTSNITLYILRVLVL